ncbi:putative hydroxypyruvate isomerase [Trichoplax sp. H2]|nr:putative hydroxypyruvate isomerase [Trichoplax sp. H2]|eukprot:RDD36829.1 putative hydroxypyruvate isomerase [Trichoplax sp. H2]
MSKIPLRFAANITTMFTEIANFADRYGAAAAAGFKGVECMFPYMVPVEQLKAVKESAGVDHVLMNAIPGNWEAGDRGIAAIPGRENEFRDSLQKSLLYAKTLQCKRIHVMAGLLPKSYVNASVSEQRELWRDYSTVYVRNMQYAADLFRQASFEDITLLIEPINSKLSIPLYFVDTHIKALELIRAIDRENVKLQLDLFHIQVANGNLTKTLHEIFKDIGHIQISQVPNRNEPDEIGEINYPYIFNTLQKLGYNGWIGCEYFPRGKTLEGLEWAQKYLH